MVFLYYVLRVFLVLLIGLTHAFASPAINPDKSDRALSQEVMKAYEKKKSLQVLGLSVSADDGVIRLQGYVRDKETFVDLLRIAMHVKGVKSVDVNHLEMIRENSAWFDAYITAKIEAAVLKAKVLDDESVPLVGINAKTIDGVVVLTGKVKRKKAIVAILNRANEVKGVKKIISHLVVAP